MALFDLLSKSYFKDKREQEKAERAQGLMEQLNQQYRQPQAVQYGSLLSPQTETVNQETGQTFITGGEMMQGQGAPQGLLIDEPGMQRQYDADLQSGLAGIYGAKGLMQDLAKQEMVGRQAMDRHMTMNPAQAGALSIQQAQFYRSQAKDARDFVTKANSSKRETVENVQNLQSVMPRHEQSGAIDWTQVEENGAVQHDIVMTYAKTILPGEAVMSDDRGNITLATTNAPDYLKGVINAFNQGQLDASALRKLYEHSHGRAAAMYQSMQRNRAFGESQGARLLPNVNYQGEQAPQATLDPNRYRQVQ